MQIPCYVFTPITREAHWRHSTYLGPSAVTYSASMTTLQAAGARTYKRNNYGAGFVAANDQQKKRTAMKPTI